MDLSSAEYKCKGSFEKSQVHFPNLPNFAQNLSGIPLGSPFELLKARKACRGRRIYRITGRVVPDFGFPGVEAEQLELLPLVADSRY